MKRLLLVDAESAIRDALGPHIGPTYDMVHAPSGGEALALLGRDPVDLAILEYRLPDLSGLDLLARIKEMLPRLPVIVVTAFGSESVCASAFKLGARNYFVKPCNPAELLASIDCVLSAVGRQRERRTNVLAPFLSAGVQGRDGPIQRAMRFMEENYGEPISLEEVARRAGVGRFALSRKFKEVTNISFRRYLLELRIAKATGLLAEATHTITEVAQMAGFSDLPRFDKVFKARVGMTPLAYRASAFPQGRARKGKK